VSRADRSQVSPASTSSPVPKTSVFIGATAVGKTGLATSLLLEALQNGHRGLFLEAQDLFDENDGRC
jgi:DNA replication protein DnaC